MERWFDKTFQIGHFVIGWRTVTFTVAVVGIIGSVLFTVRASQVTTHTTVQKSCNQLTTAIQQSQGIPRKFDKLGRPIPTPSEVYVKVILRRAKRQDLVELERAVKAYPPLRKAKCDV